MRGQLAVVVTGVPQLHPGHSQPVVVGMLEVQGEPDQVYCCGGKCTTDENDEVTDTPPPVSNGCPPDWIRLQDTCYLFREKDAKYLAAVDYCNDVGGKLFESTRYLHALDGKWKALTYSERQNPR